MPARLLALAFALLLVTALHARAEEPADAAPAPPRIYKWTDENGIAHYTTDPKRIPERLRNRVGLPRAGETRAAQPEAPAPTPDAQTAEEDVAEPSAEPAPAPPAPPAPRASAVDAGSGVSEPLAYDRSTAPTPGAAPAPEESTDFQEGPPASTDEDPAAERDDLDARIRALEDEIAADEEALKSLIATATPGEGELAGDDPAFRAIAERLPRRLADLRALEAERTRLGEP